MVGGRQTLSSVARKRFCVFRHAERDVKYDETLKIPAGKLGRHSNKGSKVMEHVKKKKKKKNRKILKHLNWI